MHPLAERAAAAIGTPVAVVVSARAFTWVSCLAAAAASVSARRKRLSNALKTLNIDWSVVVAEPQWRADDVGVAEFVEIAQWVDEHAAEGIGSL